MIFMQNNHLQLSDRGKRNSMPPHSSNLTKKDNFFLRPGIIKIILILESQSTYRLDSCLSRKEDCYKCERFILQININDWLITDKQ